jgi:mono/diheme cytochrome c family protein
MRRALLVFLAAAAGFAPCLLTPKVHAQGQVAGDTIWSGVFSDIQARRGERIAGNSCSGCHGPELEGGDSGPKLAGPVFLQKWSGKTVWELFDFIQTGMPQDSPGSLSKANVANVLAYILEANKAASGASDLPLDQAALAKIRIVGQVPQK